MSTIAAIATPPGQGGIGIVRISGPRARNVLSDMFRPAKTGFAGFMPWRLHYGHIVDRKGRVMDECLVVFMPAPHTFTGEDSAEIQCHGNYALCRLILAEVLEHDVRQAERGEFSRRAFINGKIDLSQAEAIAELSAAPGRSAMRHCLRRLDGELGRQVDELRQKLNQLRMLACVELDFTTEETGEFHKDEFCALIRQIIDRMDQLLQAGKRANLAQNGCLVVLAGPVNAGKSSILNRMAGRERALVTPIAGTTRDFIEEYIDLDGIPVRLVDTAGLRLHDARKVDPIEEMGIRKSEALLADADLVILVMDGAREYDGIYDNILERISGQPHIIVWNKSDIRRPPACLTICGQAVRVLETSAQSGENMDELLREMKSSLCADSERSEDPAPNVRQSAALRAAVSELRSLLAELEKELPLDLCLARLDTASAHLDDLLGLAAHDELLDQIFASFCIGK